MRFLQILIFGFILGAGCMATISDTHTNYAGRLPPQLSISHTDIYMDEGWPWSVNTEIIKIKQKDRPLDILPPWPREEEVELEKIPSHPPPEFDLPIKLNPEVENFIHYYQGPGREILAEWLSRSSRYLPLVQSILARKELPQDLAYIALIESGFNPYACSHRSACGPWQFIPATARAYGLIVDWWIDERLDPERATYAAARYLQHLYQQLGSWELAIAGYNCGETKISRAVKKYHTRDFWELARYPAIDQETKNFVPKMFAAAIIAKNPAAYGFADLLSQSPLQYDKVTISAPTHLAIIARACGSTLEEIKVLNPGIKRDCTPPHNSPYEVNIPRGEKHSFLDQYARIPKTERLTFHRHQIARGESLWTIARLYQTQMEPIVEINNLKNPRFIREGNYLIIPVKERTF